MKAHLEFDLPEEKEDFEAAAHGFEYKMLLRDLDEWLRERQKYGAQEIISITEIREWINNEIIERELPRL